MPRTKRGGPNAGPGQIIVPDGLRCLDVGILADLVECFQAVKWGVSHREAPKNGWLLDGL